MKNLVLKYFPLAIIVLTVFSVQQWLRITVTVTAVTWVSNLFIISTVLILRFNLGDRIRYYVPRFDLILISVYFGWMLFDSFRGAIIADNYWEWKQLITGMFSLSLPVFVYIFSIPVVLCKTLNYWFKYALIIFIFLLPFLYSDAYHFFLGPIFLVGCFLPILQKKWRIIIAALLAVMIFINLGARSQVIKSFMVLLIAGGVYFSSGFASKWLKMIHWICYIVPVVLLFLGLTGTFNIFEGLSLKNEGKYEITRTVDGKNVTDDLSADTRTFIYKEVISSAIKHDYVLWGRTPARGNDSVFFGRFSAEELGIGKFERHSNELCHTNVFTWLGLIGLILYSCIYLRSSYLAVFKSNSIYMKFLGCFIAFRWAYGWVEDFNRFDIMNVSLWMMIAMGISIRFRSMSNRDFYLWVLSIFDMKDSMRNNLIAKKNV